MKFTGISKTALQGVLCCSFPDAAEQKARTTYDNILRMVKDPEVADPIRFLRKREIVHFQRFGETLRNVQEQLNSRNFYAFNPAFDLPQGPNCSQYTDNLTASPSSMPMSSDYSNGCQNCMNITQI